jgi:hypothetical protein
MNTQFDMFLNFSLGITECVPFPPWLPSLDIIFLRTTHIAVHGCSLFLLLYNVQLYEYTAAYVYILLSVGLGK